MVKINNSEVKLKMFLKELKNETQLPKPIYKSKPYVVKSNENVILSAGTFDDVLSLLTKYGDYYADCIVDIRKYDLFMNDNTKTDDNSKVKRWYYSFQMKSGTEVITPADEENPSVEDAILSAIHLALIANIAGDTKFIINLYDYQPIPDKKLKEAIHVFEFSIIK